MGVGVWGVLFVGVRKRVMRPQGGAAFLTSYGAGKTRLEYIVKAAERQKI